jgi:hypothetical protein
MDDDDAVVEGARAIRPYLGRLAGSSAVAAELDRHLADALNGSSGRQEPPASSGTCPTARKTPHGSWPKSWPTYRTVGRPTTSPITGGAWQASRPRYLTSPGISPTATAGQIAASAARDGGESGPGDGFKPSSNGLKVGRADLGGNCRDLSSGAWQLRPRKWLVIMASTNPSWLFLRSSRETIQPVRR